MLNTLCFQPGLVCFWHAANDSCINSIRVYSAARERGQQESGWLGVRPETARPVYCQLVLGEGACVLERKQVYKHNERGEQKGVQEHNESRHTAIILSANAISDTQYRYANSCL